jgi:hypothetical protein
MTSLTKGTVVDSFEQLEEGLTTWSSFAGSHQYDAFGMMALLCACMENLRKNVRPEEWSDLGSALSEDERAFLMALAEAH